MPGKQDLIRKDNILDIVNVLRQSSCFAANIAKQINLSGVAVSKILAIMKDIGIVIEDGNVQTEFGRKPTLLKLNPNFAAVAVVMANESACKVYFVSITGQIIDKVVFEDANMFISKSKVSLIQKTIADFIVKSSLKLLSIAFSISGKVNSETGEMIYAQKIEDYKNTNFKLMFERIFNVPVLVVNDMNFAIEGEKNYSENKGIMANTLYLYLDHGTGSALMLDGRIIHGYCGLAGELGLFNLSTYNTAFLGQDSRLCNNYIALNAMVNMYDAVLRGTPYDKNYDRTDSDVNKFISLYNSGDLLAHKVVDNSAKCLGSLLYSLAEFLNLKNVIISGKIKQLGDSFLNLVKEYINNNKTFVTLDVIYSVLDKEAATLGAINSAIAAGLEQYINQI